MYDDFSSKVDKDRTISKKLANATAKPWPLGTDGGSDFSVYSRLQ